jgi:adenylosuccinate lyase
MLGLLTGIVNRMRVNEGRMAQNVDASRGLFFSEKVLTALVESGMARQAAYRAVQRSAMAAWESSDDFRSLLEADDEVRARLSAEELDRIFDIEGFLQHIDATFERVGLRGQVAGASTG